MNAEGQILFKHGEKANLLCESFKERHGTSEYSEMRFDLGDLLNLVDDLEQLEGHFSKEEIDRIIHELPTDKSPGSDGFNTDFMKKC